MNYHFLQSTEWENFQKQLGKETIRKKTENFEYLAIIEETKLGNYLYLPYGPLLDEKNSKKALNDALKSLTSLAKEKSAIFIRIEPTTPFTSLEMAKYGLKKSKDLNPKETWVLSLKENRETILTNFSQGTRTRYNTFAKKGISIEKTKDTDKISYLVDFQKKIAKQKHIGVFSENYLKTELNQDFACLYIAKYEEKPIAASLFFDDKKTKTRFYMQSAADPEYKKLPATVAILTTALFDAKEKGENSFDFWGIAPENAKKTHPWYGFTQFKKSFGGKEVCYSGTWDYAISKPKYLFYSAIRRINLLKRRIFH